MSTFSQTLERGPDGGPIYAETNLDNWISEPYNAVTAGLFVFIALYWALKIRRNIRSHVFLAFAIPVLAIGGVGGTLYHAFRASPLALFLDWLPIAILCLSAALVLLLRLVKKWYWAVLYIILFMGLETLNFRVAPPQYAINISYSLMGALILVPLFTYLLQARWKNAGWVWLALGSFILAVTSRAVDQWSVLPMGTHFLWHVFGAITCHAMLTWFYLDAGPPRH